jgi:NAD dependent epimerase/dehydratase family enzyme
MPTPAFALRLALGEVADVITTGQRVLPKRALELGMTFRFPTIDAALADILR